MELDELDHYFQRSPEIILIKVKELNISRTAYWTKKEKYYLRKHYQTADYTTIIKNVKKSLKVVKNKVKELDLIRKWERRGKTDTEFLMEYYPLLGF